MRSLVAVCALAGAVVLVGCSVATGSASPSDLVDAGGPPSSEGDSAALGVTVDLSVVDNPNSVLAKVALFRATDESSARVVVRHAGSVALTTPTVALDADGAGTVPLLGLAPSTTYDCVLESPPGVARRSVSISTGKLPPLLDALKITTKGTATGSMFLISGASSFAAAFDGRGTFRWYRRFQDKGLEQTTVETKMAFDATFTTFVGGSTDGYVRYRADGTLLATYRATADPFDAASIILRTDPHELLVTRAASGSEELHLFGFSEGPGGGSWRQLMRQASDGKVLFRWKTSDHFTADDQTATAGGEAGDHPNAIAIDPNDGNYVLSLRNLDALVKVDRSSGVVLWQLGGKRNQFAIVDDPLGGFQGQHSVHVLSSGNLLLFDNGIRHSPPTSRAVEYRLDLEKKTATMVWSYRHAPSILTPVTGSVERLANGNTLVAFAFAGVVDEVDPTGAVVWEATIRNRSFEPWLYRVRSLPSLYESRTP